MKTRIILLLCATALLGGGCTSSKSVQKSAVVPQSVVTTHASLDGNKANSGIVDSDDGGVYVTQHYRDRYNALLAVYGSRLSPPRQAGDSDGIMAQDPNSQHYRDGARWIFTGEVISQRFDPMNQWRKQDASAPPTPTPKP